MRTTPSTAKRMAALTGVAVALTMAACSNDDSTSAGTAGDLASGDSAPVTLSFVTYQGGEQSDKYREAIASYQDANPNVTIELEILPGDDTYNSVIKSRMEGGSAPDLFEILNSVPGLIPYVEADLVQDLSAEPWVADELPVVGAAAGFTGDKTFAYTGILDAGAVFYNKAVFEENGVAVPTDWNEFLAAIDTFKAAGVTPLAVGAKDGWPLVVQALQMAASVPEFELGSDAAAGLVDGSATFTDSAAWRQVVTDIASLAESGAYQENASGDTFDASVETFATGDAAMLIQGTFALAGIRLANETADIGMFPMPYVDAGETPVLSVSYGAQLSIPTASENVDEAKKFLRYLAEDDVLAQFLTTAKAYSPKAGVAATELDPALEELQPALDEKSSEYNLAAGLTPATQSALLTGLQAIVAGSGSVDETLAAMDRAQEGA